MRAINSLMRAKVFFHEEVFFSYLVKPMVILSGSVADPGCLFRIILFHPGSQFPDPGYKRFRIPDPHQRI